MTWLLILVPAAILLAAHLACHRAWQQAAERLGLTFAEESFWGEWEIYGEVRGCRVVVKNMGRVGRGRGRYTRVTVTGQRKIAMELELKAETLLTRANKLLGSDDVQVGDRDFDARVNVRGREEVVFGVLDARARSTVQRYTHVWQGEVLGGEVLREGATVMRRATSIQQVVLDSVRVAEVLQVPEGGYVAALLRNLDRDPLPSVRRKCLELLLKRGAEVADRALKTALGDADPEVRLAAASAAGREAVAVLVELAAATDLADGVAERALLRLAEVDPGAAGGVAVAIVLGPPGASTPRAIELVGHLGRHDLSARIEQFTRHPDEVLAGAAAQALGALGTGEEALVAMLGHGGAEARRAAVQALGAVATLSAVQPLLRAAERGVVPRKEAREAVLRIQGRHARADAGGLAVVEEGAGGLAVVTEGGGLAVVRESAAAAVADRPARSGRTEADS